MRTEASVVVDRAVDDVFRLTTEHVAEWSELVVQDELLDEKPARVGSTFRTVTEEDGKRMEFQGVVTRHDPPHAHSVRLVGDAFDIEADYDFDCLAGRTRVTQSSRVVGKGAFGLVLFFCGWLAKRSSLNALEKELASLKRFCEAHADPESV